jgi:hypothetical protein
VLFRRRLATPVLVATTATVALTGCVPWGPAGDQTTREREVVAVTAVVLETSGDLVVTRGDTPRLVVTAGENTLEKLTTDSAGGTLRLGKRSGANLRGDIRYELTVPALTAVTVESSGTAEVDLAGAADPTLVVDGSGRIEARNIEARALTVRIGGSGRVVPSGRTDRQTVTVDGSGAYEAYELASTEATVTMEGSGRARVQATGTLRATVEGSGSITHRGGARVEQRIDGSGSVTEG